jgi:hypothetical protein
MSDTLGGTTGSAAGSDCKVFNIIFGGGGGGGVGGATGSSGK